jgi:hypothetical protein
MVSEHYIQTAEDLELAISNAAQSLPRRITCRGKSVWTCDPQIIELRRVLQSLCSRFGHNSEEANQAESNLIQAHKIAVEKHMEDIAGQLDVAHEAGRSREAWGIINNATGRKSHPRTIVAATSVENRIQKVAAH